jgi:two-component system sensor histidine kinase KdpD
VGFGQEGGEASPLAELNGTHTLSRLAGGVRSYALGLLTVFIITITFRDMPLANLTTVGFTFLLAILVAAATRGLDVSLLMSIASTAVYDYYFIPPTDTWNITDSRDWVALFAFVITSLVGSTLSAYARRQTRQARLQRREAQQLYDFSQRLLSAGDALALCKALPSDIVDSFGASAAALLVAENQTLYFSPGGSNQFDASLLKSSLNNRDVRIDVERGVSLIPLRLRTDAIGMIGIADTSFSRTTLDSLGSLITIAIERARAVEQVGKIEALRESERLKTALLDAITHEFRTPLTAMKISVTSMLSDLNFDREQCKDLLSMIDEGCDRIDQLVGEVSEMSRLESGEIKLEFARRTVEELIEAALADCKNILGGRPIETGTANQDVAIHVDLFWAAKVLVHLLMNANLYSTPGKPITIRVDMRQAFVVFSVTDQGPGIDSAELSRIFEKFYRGKEYRCRVQGTGMGLPIAKAIVEAHGGTIGATSKVGEGSTFTFALPVDRSSETGE